MKIKVNNCHLSVANVYLCVLCVEWAKGKKGISKAEKMEIRLTEGFKRFLSRRCHRFHFIEVLSLSLFFFRFISCFPCCFFLAFSPFQDLLRFKICLRPFPASEFFSTPPSPSLSIFAALSLSLAPPCFLPFPCCCCPLLFHFIFHVLPNYQAHRIYCQPEPLKVTKKD